MRTALVLMLVVGCASAQDIRPQVRAIAASAQGKVSTACWLAGSNLNCDLNAHGHPPMQSVFKLPLAIAVLHQVEQGKFTLDEPVRFLPSDRILPRAYTGCGKIPEFSPRLFFRGFFCAWTAPKLLHFASASPISRLAETLRPDQAAA